MTRASCLISFCLAFSTCKMGTVVIFTTSCFVCELDDVISAGHLQLHLAHRCSSICISCQRHHHLHQKWMSFFLLCDCLSYFRRTCDRALETSPLILHYPIILIDLVHMQIRIYSQRPPKTLLSNKNLLQLTKTAETLITPKTTLSPGD